MRQIEKPTTAPENALGCIIKTSTATVVDYMYDKEEGGCAKKMATYWSKAYEWVWYDEVVELKTLTN